MNPEITQKMADNYLKTGACPFCGSFDIEGSEFDFSTESQMMECIACGERWQELYRCYGISDVDFNREIEFTREGEKEYEVKIYKI